VNDGSHTKPNFLPTFVVVSSSDLSDEISTKSPVFTGQGSHRSVLPAAEEVVTKIEDFVVKNFTCLPIFLGHMSDHFFIQGIP